MMVARRYTNVGYIIPLIAFFNFGNLKYLEPLLFYVISTAFGVALPPRNLVRDPGSSPHHITRLDSVIQFLQSAVCGIWFTANVWAANTYLVQETVAHGNNMYVQCSYNDYHDLRTALYNHGRRNIFRNSKVGAIFHRLQNGIFRRGARTMMKDLEEEGVLHHWENLAEARLRISYITREATLDAYWHTLCAFLEHG